ncbi:hypothetical protein LTR37_020618 [Vermiconidia calcicola]|uniref:Uncharacterized protein n=1 Tax=Vermiconidia calcicola TaxID=1690605 RepID=A0ACC3MAS6_9PEZI|nr:hypothetical protein LTR37_020618 [Vermiconidia calcicola]
MSLTVPRSISGSKRNSARLDLLTVLLNSPSQAEQPSRSVGSPRDSLSPLDERARNEQTEKGRGRRAVDLTREENASEYAIENPDREAAANDDAQEAAGFRAAQTQQEQHVTFHASPPKQHKTAASPVSSLATACSPRCSPQSNLITRNHRPPDLKLTRINGLTQVSVQKLKQQICNGHTITCASKTHHVSLQPPKRLPKTPIVIMGNKPSSISGSPKPTNDNASERSVVRDPVRILRKSSMNLFKRTDSRSPLPAELTSGVLQVQQQVSSSTFDGTKGDDNGESPVDPYMDRTHLPNDDSPAEDILPSRAIHSASTLTPTENDARWPLSASTTIRDVKAGSWRESWVNTHTSFVEDVGPESCSKLQHSPAPPKRDSALSPSIPAPSPLPKDSPHKYGLKDRMDTPEVPEPEKIDIVKARRKSTGLDIFNEAKSLQSASSFLNGLSTSRRRAESTQRSTETSSCTNASYDTTRPPSSARLPSRPSSTRPTSAGPTSAFYSSERRRGLSFKPSGFAYTRPLTLAQMKCYRSHARLLPSRNKTAPVECAVCHIDDDQEHFSCSWCALRMCRFCRKEFAERGLTALRQRVKQAEMGSESSMESSAESLGYNGGGRGRKVFL